MNWVLITSNNAERFLKKLAQKEALRLGIIIDGLTSNPYGGDIQRIGGESNMYVAKKSRPIQNNLRSRHEPQNHPYHRHKTTNQHNVLNLRKARYQRAFQLAEAVLKIR